MKYLSVKNFERFQHYADRSPAWIKLYNRLLDDYEYIRLGEGARSQLIGLWLLASRHGNAVPYDDAYLREALHVRRLYVDELVASTFVTVLNERPEQDASSVLAERYKNASKTLAKGYQDASSTRARPRARERRGEKRREEESAHEVREQPPGAASPKHNGHSSAVAPWQAEKDQARADEPLLAELRQLIAAESKGGGPPQLPGDLWARLSDTQRDVLKRHGGFTGVWNA